METLKKYLAFSYYSLPLIDSLKDHKLVLVTPAGVIMGSPIAKNESDDSISGLATVATDFVSDYRTKYSLDPEKPLDGNDGFLILKDVTLQSGTSTHHFDILNVFYDQIIAISIGKIN